MDVFTRESLAIAVGQRLKGEEVVATLNDIRLQRGVRKFLFCDGTLRSECLDVHWFATFTGGQASHRRLGGNTMTVVLTDPWENGRRVSSPVKSL